LFEQRVSQNPQAYRLDFGLLFQYFISNLGDDYQIADMRVMDLFAEAFLAELLNCYKWRKGRWEGTCNHSALLEAIEGVSSQYVIDASSV
jgi:hypothetical protein